MNLLKRLLISLCVFSLTIVDAQTEIRKLNVGEKVPDKQFELVNYKGPKAKLSDFAGKCVLLDFWATWCTACVHKFPELDSLQRKFSDRLQVLLVNSKTSRDDKFKIKSFFENRKSLRGESYVMPTIINDSLLDKLFYHLTIPHYVWVDKNRIVKAITGPEYVTATNIENFIRGGELNLPIKNDVYYDNEKPLFVNGNGGDAIDIKYRSMLTGYVDGLSGRSGVYFDSAKKTIRMFALNHPIVGLYRATLDGEYLNSNRIVLNVDDPTDYLPIQERDSWLRQNSYCFELILPFSKLNERKEIMKEELDKVFGFTTSVEKRKVKCYVLKDNSVASPISKGEKQENNLNDVVSAKFIRNEPLSVLSIYLDNLSPLPIINESSIKQPIDISFSSDFKNVKLLQEQLSKQGFDLVEEEREIEVFVITEDGWKGGDK